MMGRSRSSSAFQEATTGRETTILGNIVRRSVERTLAWLARFRRVAVRYERRSDIFTAFHHLAAALIMYRRPHHLCFVERWFC